MSTPNAPTPNAPAPPAPAIAAPADADAPARLALSGIGCRFGPVRALDRVCLTAWPGEILGLLGDSGCGKSTLLRIVAGLERPDRGEIRFDGRRIDPETPPEARGVGLMFQDYALFPHLSVAENVRFGLNRLPRREAEGIAAARLAQVGLGHRAASYPGTLSGGEGQRVALARALAPGPRILLLDEPFSNLDRRTRDRVRADTLAVVRAAGTTTLLVTHDPEEALAFCDRIALMRDGRVVQAGTGADLYERPVSRFAARFFGDLVEMPGRCRGGRVDTPFGPLPAPGLPEAAPARVCLRPEAIRLGPAGAGLTGRVLGRRFLGAEARLAIAVEGLAEPLVLAVPAEDARRAGDAVGLCRKDAGTFIFADEPD
ncbi:ABC transporter ATP-binding protein [Methylobacterium planeticum]|uniref:ABC transporter ATP-binding protein n=1 Tax=Methylobacterium planeticum TaxID=2615211 RepID=A0A6N6MLK6_9HYPH|nr:ABC transporter ATP-binding protein [Methylobacterium planeticum]KAB1072132.1 ABC transporter ATP-binding protein [Methylobacterium planeticum]